VSGPDAPADGKKRSNPRLRVISGVVLGLVTLALAWAGGPWFRFFAAAMMLLMFHEWAAMIGLRRGRAHHLIAWGGLALTALALLAGKGEMVVFALVLVSSLAALASGVVFGQGAAAAAGVAYSGLSGACLAFLRGDTPEGLAAIAFLFAVVWSTDIFAYYVGRAAGGPKLAPSISPGKTWSGALGGLAAAVLCGAAVSAAMGQGWAVAALAAVPLSVVSQLGDLAESAAKRRYGVKDSGTLIPGHGGVMDRVDGLVAAAIALYVIAAIPGAGFAP
jgi:phosphatidate cytidylyltransferase